MPLGTSVRRATSLPVLILRYVMRMKQQKLFLALVLWVGAASWVHADQGHAEAAPSAQERRRAELREALKRPAEREGAANAKTPEGAGEPRRLSAQERADLRQQLRAQPARAGLERQQTESGADIR